MQLSEFCNGEVSPGSILASRDSELERRLHKFRCSLRGECDEPIHFTSSSGRISERIAERVAEPGGRERMDQVHERINDAQFNEAMRHFEAPWEGADWLSGLKENADQSAIRARFVPKNVRNGVASKYVKVSDSGRLIATLKFRFGRLLGQAIPNQIASTIEMEVTIKGAPEFTWLVETERLMWGMEHYGHISMSNSYAGVNLQTSGSWDVGKIMPVKFLGLLARIVFLAELVDFLDDRSTQGPMLAGQS